MGKTYDEVLQTYRECEMNQDKWIESEYSYLLAMDALKCALGRKEVFHRQNRIKRWSNAAEYYGLWSIHGFVGSQKFRKANNFEESHSELNPFWFEYS